MNVCDASMNTKTAKMTQMGIEGTRLCWGIKQIHWGAN